MTIQSIAFLCAAFLLAACNEKAEPAPAGILGTMGPTKSPDGSVLSNIVTFDYDLEAPRQIQFWVKGEQIKSVEVDGKGSWRIEASSEKLRISDASLIFETPIPQAGILASNSSINKEGHRGWDISIDGHNVVRLQSSPIAGTGPES